MEPVDSLIQARWVLPIEPGAGVLEDHAVVVHGGRIVAILPIAVALARYAPDVRIERPHHVLLPGLVNTHTHAAMTLLRGRAENLPLEPWLEEGVRPIERRWVDPEYVRDGTELAIAEMLQAGITCFADMHVWPDVVARTAAELHMRASVGLVVLERVTSWASGPDDYIEQGLALHDQYKGDTLVNTHFASHSIGATTDATLLRVRRLVDELEVPFVTHLHESAAEVELSVAQHGQRPLARLHQLGLASPLLVAVHLTQAAEADMETLARANAAVVHCPQSNLKLGNGLCPVTELAGRGVRVALGSDGAAANNDLDILGEAQTAGLLAAGISARPGALIASDLLRMATLEGARALGLGDSVGSLVPGKWADLCCVDLRSARSWPVHDVAATLVYACSARQVTDTWVAGRHVLADGALRYIDESAVLERAEAWRRRIDAGDGRSEKTDVATA